MPVGQGTQFGDCEILAPLGAGGMGEVYRARDNSLEREVAVKLLPDELASDSERLRRFEQEARIAAALNHPNILTIYRFGEKDGRTPYLITELLQGQTLRERLLTGPIPVRKTVDYALQTTRGLAAAHDRGIVHRDLKPENIFITRDGVVKILDFGLAKLLSSELGEKDATLTLPGVVLGTVGYMSPEQVRAQASDHRSDIFSLGAILYEMLSGSRAFHGATSADTMSAILKEEPPELGLAVHNLPPVLGRIVHRCLEKEPGERFQSVRDLAFNLELLAREDSGSGAVPVLSSGKKRGWQLSALAISILLMAVALGMAVEKYLTPKARLSAPVALHRLTDFAGMEESPALSPDGRTVAFTSVVAGHRQIWVRLLAGGTPLQVTHGDTDHQFPRWSPDSGSLIYFSPSAEPHGPGQVWEIPALGGTARPVIASVIAADLSHDGKRIVYLRASQGQLELTEAERSGADSRTIAKLPSDFIYSNLRWSPNDRLVAFQRGRTFDYDVFYVPADGGEVEPITHDGNPEGGFAWLPDSSSVIYSSARGETILYLPPLNLWTAQLDGSRSLQLTFGETSYLSPDLDRDGNIVVSRSDIQFDIWKFPTSGTAQENMQKAVRVTRQTGAVQTPSVAPNGNELVYLGDSGGHGNLWLLNQENGQVRQVTFEQDPHVGLGVPVWSPDGAHIAYVSRGKTGWNVDLWVVNPDGRNAHKVADGGGWACWSPDGQWLYYSPPTEKGWRIDKVHPDGSDHTVVRDQGERVAIASDGTLYSGVGVAGVNGVSDLEIHAAKPETAEAKLVATIPGSRLLPESRLSSVAHMQPVLSPDGKWLALMLVDGNATDIWTLPVGGGEMKKITDFGDQATFIARRVSWSPDGKWIYAAVGKGEADIVQLSNLIQ
jgi:eukaryotic-like serine/threonine-protein kinase